jgi:DNA-binding IclR family transcriptional regulator
LKTNGTGESLNKSLAKALEILDAFTAQHPERGVRELGRELGINPATIYRVARTLLDAGYLEQNPENQNYLLGPKVLKLANVYNFHYPLPTVAKRVFESYVDRFEHNFYLATLNRYEVIYLAVHDGSGPLKVAAEPGLTMPLHSNALGKILLAQKSDQFILEFMQKNKLTAFTSRTISDPEKLWEQLRKVREQGYAINDGEQYDAIGAVAVILYNAKGHPLNLALSLTYPRHFVHDGTMEIPALIDLGREIAQELTRRSDVSHWF